MEQFERIRKIGKGNFGDVLLVRRKADQKLFALKRVDLSFRESFVVDPLNEAKVLKSLDHPNIIAHYDSFIQNNKLCILMEYAENADLSLKIKDAKSSESYIEEATVVYLNTALLQILNWLAQLAIGIQHLHSQKILHRDIKVQNIFLCHDGMVSRLPPLPQVKLGDFGISRTLDSTLDLAQTSIGTPFYLSPEICQNQQYNHKIDIWMLGCTLYELCSLQKPFSGDSIHALAHKITHEKQEKIPDYYSEFMAELVDWMLEKNPDKRPEVSTILQLPQIQNELQRMSGIYAHRNSISQDSNQKKSRMQQNSIHFLVEKTRLQQQAQSPMCSRRSQAKHGASEQNSPTFRQLNKSGHKERIGSNINLHTLPECQEEQQFHAHSQSERSYPNEKQLKFQKAISINTQIEESSRRNQDVESQPTLIKNVKQFSFADQFFNPNTPTSPQRSILLTDFLKRKIGNEKFAQMKLLLESSNDPIRLLDSQKNLCHEILGDQHMDCIKIFKLLISSSITPQAAHARTKSASIFCEEKDNLIDLIKDCEYSPQMTIGMNPGFEISFKNLKNCDQQTQSGQVQLQQFEN